jgi:hypothetical protein
MDSNYTLRFNRSAREAYGHDVQFKKDPDRIVWIAALIGIAFVICLMILGVV